MFAKVFFNPFTGKYENATLNLFLMISVLFRFKSQDRTIVSTLTIITDSSVMPMYFHFVI